MILLAYILFGALLLVVSFPAYFWRSNRSHSTIEKSNFLDSFTIIHSLFYLVVTIFIIAFVPMPSLAFRQYLIIDPLSVYEVLITSLVFLLASIYGRGYLRGLLQKEEIKVESLELFYSAFNLLLLVIVFCFFSNNLALFWILLELTTILSAVLIVALSAKENINAALKYVFIASTAMLFSVIGLIILFAMTQQLTGAGTLNWDQLMGLAGSLSPKMFAFAFTFIFIGFASKAGITPFHTWLPQAHAKAPSMVSAVLSAVLLNAGTYGIIRLYSVAHRTASSQAISIILISFGALSIALAALSMLPRSNIKKLIGFSSIEHMGLMLIGTGVGTPLAIFWTLFHILGHSLTKSLMFFSAGILSHQYNSSKMEEIVNAFRLQPLASWGMIIGSVAVIGVPPFPIFLSKLFILSQLGSVSLPLLFIVLVLLLIVGSAFTFLFIRVFSRQAERTVEPYAAHWTMKASIVLLFVLVMGSGVYLIFGLGDLLTRIAASLGF